MYIAGPSSSFFSTPPSVHLIHGSPSAGSYRYVPYCSRLVLLGEMIDCLSSVVRRDSYRANTPSLLAGFQQVLDMLDITYRLLLYCPFFFFSLGPVSFTLVSSFPMAKLRYQPVL